MRAVYFDCIGGAAGDMLLSSLIDAGVPHDAVRAALDGLSVSDYTLDVRARRVGPFAATGLEVEVRGKQPPRRLSDITALLDAAGLAPAVRERALMVFRRLAEAEARVHGTDVDQVHFHEVGAVDSIVDIVGTVVALDWLGVSAVRFGMLSPGSGTTRGEHGVIPLPAPATLELLTGVPIRLGGEPGEWVTPTGAALLSTLGVHAAEPAMTVEQIGVGAGTRPRSDRPNVVRALIGELDDAANPAAPVSFDRVVVIEATIDDSTPEAMAHAADRLRDAGALDVTLAPVVMKRGRSGVVLSVLGRPGDTEKLAHVVLAETSTLGVRVREESRRVLPRRVVAVDTAFGVVRVKETERPAPPVGDGAAGPAVAAAPSVDAAPEARDVAERARESGVSFNTVQRAALEAYWRQSR